MTPLDLLVAIGLLGCLVGLGVCVIELRRNNQVYRFRLTLIGLIHDENVRRIYAGEPETDLWVAFKEIDYDDQVTRFWRPLDSWLTDPALRALWDAR